MADSPIVLGHDPVTLRERIDVDAATARLADIQHLRSLAALGEQASLLRLLGRLDEAFDKAQAALRQSRFTGSREDSLAARIRRAHVVHWQGKRDAALVELTNCVDEAVAHEWADLAGLALQRRGCVLLELQRPQDAVADFERALEFRSGPGAPSGLVEETKFALRVARAAVEAAEDAQGAQAAAGANGTQDAQDAQDAGAAWQAEDAGPARG